MDLLFEIKTTAERVERMRLLHEDALEDLRQKLTEARAAGLTHAEIERALDGSVALPGRFEREQALAG